MAYNPYTGQDDPNYNDGTADSGGYDPNTGQPAAPAAPTGHQGTAPSAAGVGSPGNWYNQIQGFYGKYLGRQGSDSDINGWANGMYANDPNGLSTIENAIANSPEADAYNKANQLGKYAPGAPAQPGQKAPGLQLGNVFTFSGGGTPTDFSKFQFQQDPRYNDLVNTLMSRAQASTSIDPNTDPVIRPQVDNYGAQQERSRRNAIDEAAESGSPYQTGSLDNLRRQTAESAGVNTANMQAALVNNELTARRKDITDALQESGSMLTADQQMRLQNELGIIDANLKQQQMGNQNDQFLAQLGLNTENQANYWDAIKSGLIKG